MGKGVNTALTISY